MQTDSIESLHLTPDVFPYHISHDIPLPEVTFKGGQKALRGNILTPTIVQDAPTVRFEGAEEHACYVVFMTDPDAPSRADPRFREWWHWIVTNIPGSDLKKGDLSAGDTHWSYVGAGPPEGSGLHRYVIAIYKQKSKKTKFEGAKGLTGTGRGKQHLEQFATKYGLGHPVALAAFQAEFDDYVPQLYKKIAD